MKPLKPKTCKVCGAEFNPVNSFQKCADWRCALSQAQEKRVKKEKKIYNAETKRRKDKAKTRTQWLNEAQTQVNKYVRLRDKGRLCISCDKPDNGGHQRHASHYKSVGANSALRFNLWNIHTSCSSCNNHLSGNIGEYTPRLIKKIGQDKYDWLLTQNQTVKYEIDYIKRLKQIFARRCRILQARID